MDKIQYFFKKGLKRWQILIFSILFIFLGSFLIFEGIDYLNEKFTCEFSTSVQININNFFNEEKLNETKNSKDKYKNIDINTIIKENGITISQTDEDTYVITSYSRYFKSFLSDTNNSKGFVKAYLKLMIGEDNVIYSDENTIVTIDYINTYLCSFVSSAILLIPLTIIVGLPKEKDEQNFYDNKETFRTPFHKQYWIDSLSFLKDTKSITTLSMLFALMLASKLVSLPSGFGILGLSFAYLFFSTIGLIYGPIAGLLIGFLSDVLGFFLFDTSGFSFFIGYSIQAMITGLIYGIMFFKTKISFKRI